MKPSGEEVLKKAIELAGEFEVAADDALEFRASVMFVEFYVKLQSWWESEGGD